MESINGLSDDLLVKILSFLPTKVAVSTSILSKRWECLWMRLPELEFDASCDTLSEYERLRCFLERNLPLHRAPVIKSFSLNLMDSSFRSEDVKLWVIIALTRHLRELYIFWYYCDTPEIQNILPSSLYNCKSLVTLSLVGPIVLDVPRMVCLSSLKTLRLEVQTLNGESLRRFLSICPLLEDLMLDLFENFCPGMGKINITVPSLQRLSLFIPSEGCLIDGLLIDTPSLKYLKLEVHSDESYSCSFKNMPKLEEAYVDVEISNIESLIGSITSVKRLSICSEAVNGGGDGFVFNQLEHLKLCVRREYSLNLLIRFLQDSPNLRVLDLNNMHLYKREYHHKHDLDGLVRWNQPSTVLKCMSNLQTFSWSKYYGRPLGRDIAVYILKNARCLKTATISSDERFVPKLEMIKELSRSSRASTSCELLFD